MIEEVKVNLIRRSGLLPRQETELPLQSGLKPKKKNFFFGFILAPTSQ